MGVGEGEAEDVVRLAVEAGEGEVLSTRQGWKSLSMEPLNLPVHEEIY